MDTSFETHAYYYLATDGGLYHDEGLCDLWKAAVTPSPTPTPTVTPTASPTPNLQKMTNGRYW